MDTIEWHHCGLSGVVERTSGLHLYIYLQWFEGSAQACADHLTRRSLIVPDQPIDRNCKARTHWLRWLNDRRWSIDGSQPSSAHRAQCALIDTIQIGYQLKMLDNPFAVPGYLHHQILLERRLDGRAKPPTHSSRHGVLYRSIVDQLTAWWFDPAHPIDLPTRPARTAFQRRALSAICTIPCGQVDSYQGIARRINNHPRAVGQACRRNHLPLIVPCHRVVARHSAGGYLGQSCERDDQADALKKALVSREGGRMPTRQRS